MTFAQFMALKAGDVVSFNGTLRTVIQGPHQSGRPSVLFVIRNRSWRNKGWTWYGWNDVKDKIRQTNKVTNRVCLPEERMRLERVGFSAIGELRKAWREELACSLRLGHNCGLSVRRLPVP